MTIPAGRPRRRWSCAGVALPPLLTLLTLATACRRGDDGAVTAVGTVELVETDVAPTVGGRVSRVWVDEGAAVRAGDTLLTLVAPTQPAELSARAARVAQASAELRDLTRGARPEDVQRAAAELRAAGADAERAARDLERLTPLAAAGTISQQQLDAARGAARESAARRDAARHALELLQAGPRADAVVAARARVAEASAQLASSRTTQGELTLVAPAAGVVLGRWVEVGELVAPGQPALTLGDAARPWARIYVNQRDLPRVRVGGAATGRLDGVRDRAFAGRVAAVSPTAEFSPRVALTEDERADLVFGVKVEFADTSGMLKAGLPITVRVAGGPPDERGGGGPTSAAATAAARAP